MGVDIGAILEKEELSLNEIQGRIAVDAFNTLFQFITIIRQKDGTPLMDSKGRVTSHLSGLFYRTCSLLEKGIKPVFVFDGAPHPLKKRVIAEREARKVEAEEKYRKAVEEGRVEELKMYAQQFARLSDEMVAESKLLLEFMGLPWVQAPSEGEAQCAWMCREGLVSAAASQDFDALLFGAPYLIRNITIAGRRKLPRREVYVDVVPERYDLQANLNRLGISHRKLVWIGVMAGTDFSEGIHGIGPKKALKLVQKHETFEEILGDLKTELDYKAVEEIFLEPAAKKISAKDIEFKQPQRDKIMELMNGEHEFLADRIENALARAFKEPLDSEQSGLHKWF